MFGGKANKESGSIGNDELSTFDRVKALSVRKLSDFLESNPEFTVWVLQKLLQIVPSNIDQAHIDLMVDAILYNEKVTRREKIQIIVIGPHYSVVDIAGFLKIIKAIQNHESLKGREVKQKIMGPASSKFFDHEKAMFAKVLIKPLMELGVVLYQVAQVQDIYTRNKLGAEGVNNLNLKAWKQILQGLYSNIPLGIFITGTREVEAGVSRAPLEICEALGSILRPNAQVIPLITDGSDDFLGIGMLLPDITKIPEVITSYPIRYGEMVQLAEALNEHISAEVVPLHPVEVANILAVIDKPHRWGQLKPFIELLQNPTQELLAKLETILPAVTNTEYLMDFPNVNLGLLINSLIDGLSKK